MAAAGPDESSRPVFYDGTKGAHFPFGWSDLFGWRPFWGRQDPLVYVIPLLLAGVMAMCAYFVIPPVVGWFGAVVGIFVVLLGAVVPFVVGWWVSRRGWQTRLVPRLLRFWLAGRRASRSVVPESEFEPAEFVVAASVFLPVLDPRGDGHEAV